ncbi:MAG: alanine racemase [Rhizobiaceae bacterium]|nr:alanine racemase [Rhizobiaceae bacterium]
MRVSQTPSSFAAGAVLTVDIAAVRENYRRLRQRLGRATCAAVVKADSYGLGATVVAQALGREGCSTLFVAHPSEGIALREALGENPAIYVLNGIYPGAEQECANARLVAVANSMEQLTSWRAAGRRLGRQLPVAIQIDSGMSRLGMPPSEVGSLAPDALEGLDLRLVMSHLACADEPENPANEAQRNAFELLRRRLPDAPASLANSSGIFLGERFHFDLARPGAALYGVNPTPGHDNPMQQAVRLSAKVIQTRELPIDIGIGYGHAYRTTRPTRTATIALGYADGWPRRAGMAAWYESVRLPFVGRVSMDSIVLDISELPPGTLHAGDLVDLICSEQTVDDVAEAAGTIGYEILTGLGGRFHRIYDYNGQGAGTHRQGCST